VDRVRNNCHATCKNSAYKLKYGKGKIKNKCNKNIFLGFRNPSVRFSFYHYTVFTY
jgi:hypothetical protein